MYVKREGIKPPVNYDKTCINALLKSWNFAEMGLGILGKVLEFFVGKVMVTLLVELFL